jgi:hypothetical protein
MRSSGGSERRRSYAVEDVGRLRRALDWAVLQAGLRMQDAPCEQISEQEGHDYKGALALLAGYLTFLEREGSVHLTRHTEGSS